MKNNAKILCGILLLMLTLGSKAQITSPFDFVNNLPCDIEIHYRVIDVTGNTGNCPTICTANNLWIPAGGAPVSVFPTPCTFVPGQDYDIQIVVINYAGNAIVPNVSANYGMSGCCDWLCFPYLGNTFLSQPMPSGTSAACWNGGFWNLSVTPTGATFY